MLLADQQVRYDADPNMSLIADTTLFYEPILEEYGYTKADYVKSVGKYMEDPEKFADIFKESKKILDDHGGKVWATSVEGEGTTIYFVIRKYQEVPLYE